MPKPTTPAVHPDVLLLRCRYSEALVCRSCARLLATRAASYVGSRLTDPERLGYLCAECRQPETEPAALAATRIQNLARRRAVNRPLGRDTGSDVRVSRKSLKWLKRERGFFVTSRRGGRPPVPAAMQAAKTRARVRAYRARSQAVQALAVGG
jgi:hypothetical protein